MHPLAEKAVCLLMTAFGLFVFEKPAYVAEKLKALCRRSPEFRGADESRLAIRPGFLRAFGALFIVVGAALFFIAR